MNLFKLVGEIFIDNEKANESLQKTDKKAGSVGDTLKKIGGTAAKVGAGVAAAAGTMITGMTKFATSTAESMDNIDKMSQRLGMSREAYQEWDYVLSQAGVDIDSMRTGFKTLTNEIGSVIEAGDTAGTAFEALGISIDDISGMSQEDIFALTVERLQQVEDQTQKATLAQDLFGKSGQEMIPLLNQTNDATAGLRDQAHELGLVMSDDAVDSGVQLHDTLDTLQRTFSAIGAEVGTAIIPIINQFAQMLIDYAPQISELIEELTPIIMQLFSELLPPIMDLINQLLPVVMSLLKQLIPPMTTLMSALLPVIVNLVTMLVPILQPVLELLSPLLNLLLAILAPLLELANVVLKPIISLISNGLTIALKALNPVLEFLSNLFSQVFGALPGIAKGALNGLIGFLNGAIDGVNLLLTPLRAIIAAVGSLFGANWTMDDVAIPHIPALAKGGMIGGSGAAIVGEAGPELVNLPRGASVTPLGSGSIDEVNEKLDTLIDVVSRIVGMGVRLDSGALVGQIAPSMDMALGRLATANGRYV